MPRSPFRRLEDLADCVRDEFDIEARCLACEHLARFDPQELRKMIVKKRVWSGLKDVERAMKCASCGHRRCRLTLIDQVDSTRLDWDRGG